MAKGRMLNKTISIDKELAKLSKESLILYTWCIPHLDIKGRIFAEPEQIKGLVVPYIKWFTIDKVRKCISEISKTSLVLYYGDGFKYFEFTGFAKNQTVYEEREAKSIIPDPTQDKLMINSCVTHVEREVEVKRESKVEENKIPHLDFVFLKPSEYTKLISIYNKQNVDKYIEKLNSYIGSKGRKYKSHYYTLIAWMQKDDVYKLVKKEFKNPLEFLK